MHLPHFSVYKNCNAVCRCSCLYTCNSISTPCFARNQERKNFAQERSCLKYLPFLSWNVVSGRYGTCMELRKPFYDIFQVQTVKEYAIDLTHLKANKVKAEEVWIELDCCYCMRRFQGLGKWIKLRVNLQSCVVLCVHQVLFERKNKQTSTQAKNPNSLKCLNCSLQAIPLFVWTFNVCVIMNK